MQRKFLFFGVSRGVSTYTISGTVYDADGSTAVAGATVALGALSAVSAANGTYTITSVPAGTSGSMTCTKAGYSWAAISVAAMSGNLAAQNYSNAWWAAGGCAALCVAAYKPLGAANIAASYVNLANPGTYDCVAISAPTFDTTYGWSFNNNALDCGFKPTGGTHSAIIRLAEANTSTTKRWFGVSEAAKNFNLGFEWGATLAYVANRSNSAAGTFASGVVALSGWKYYKDGALVATMATGTPAESQYNCYIGYPNNNAGEYGIFKTPAVAFYNNGIDSYVAAISTAMAAF
jgi:hypothetical protein